MPSYNENIPQPSDFQDNSQAQILSNFKSLDTTFSADHTLFSDTTPNLGQHKQVTLYQTIVPPAPSPTVTAPTSMLWSQTTGTSPTSITNLFYSCILNNLQQNYQMTNLQIISVPGGNTGTAGGSMNYIDTPWNFRIYFGLTASWSGSNRTVLYPTPYTTMVLANGFSNTAAGDVVVSGLENLTGLNLGTNALVSVNWFAMGRL